MLEGFGFFLSFLGDQLPCLLEDAKNRRGMGLFSWAGMVWKGLGLSGSAWTGSLGLGGWASDAGLHGLVRKWCGCEVRVTF